MTSTRFVAIVFLVFFIQGALAAEPLTPAQRELAMLQNAPFSRLDRDGDGVLSELELPITLGSSFARADKDQSGGLSPEELTAELNRLQTRLARGPALDPKQPIADWQTLGKALALVVQHHELDGGALLIGKGGELLFEHYAGSYGPDTIVNVASASKWPFAAAVATAVVEGKLSLTAPLSSWKPAFAETPKGALTLPQLMSFTAGAAGVGSGPADRELDPGMPIDQVADLLLQHPLVSEPGSTFAYGGWSMQVAAAWAVAATGEPLVELWKRTVGDPAGMQHSHYGHPRRVLDGKNLPNPIVQSGLWTTPRDLGAFLRMMASGGKVEGRQVFPAEAIALMERDHARGLPHALPRESSDGDLSFGFGFWCEKSDADGSCSVVSSSGAWGTVPWLDRSTGIWGLFFVYDRGPRLRPDVAVLRAAGDALARASAGQ